MIVFLVNHKTESSLRFAIVDNSDGLSQSVVQGLNSKLEDGKPEFVEEQRFVRHADSDAVQTDLRNKINAGTLDAYLLIPAKNTDSFELHMRNPDNFSQIAPLSRALDKSVITQRLSQQGVQVDDVKSVLKGADLKLLKVSDRGEAEEKGQSIGIAIALVVLLYTSLLMYGIITMRSVIEEKTTRTMEVLISSVRPFELLAGKILGVAAVAFTQFSIWMTTTALLFSYGALAAMGMGGKSMLSGVHVPPSLILYATLFFFGGYFLYSTMFAAVGAACSNEQDAQQLQWLAMGPLVF